MIQFDCQLARPGFAFDVAFEAGPGITALFGPSGCGKTTAIRLLAGLERPATGHIAINGAPLADTASGVWVKPHRRRIGLVFQDALLLPHLSVRQNLLYGRSFTPAGERRIELDSVVDMLGIGHLLERRPATLSGGERQRAAIGRALLTSPRLLLMDEPLASLDAARKLEILPFIERLRDEFRIPIIYVSHAVDEIARLADKVVRLDAGNVVGSGPAAAMLGPGEADAAGDRFGLISILTGQPAGSSHGMIRLLHPAGDIYVAGAPGMDSGSVRVLVRGTEVTIATRAPEGLSIRTTLLGQIAAIYRDASPFVIVSLALTGGEMLHASIKALALADLNLQAGQTVHALVKSAALAGPAMPPLQLP